MAIAVVDKKQSSANPLTIASATAKNWLYVGIQQSSTAAAPKMSDNVSGETGWTIEEVKVACNGGSVGLYLAKKEAVGGETTLTATAGGGAIIGAVCFQLSGASGTIDASTHKDNQATAATVTSEAITTTDAGDILLGFVTMSTSTSGEIKPWTGTGPMENVATASVRAIGGHYIPGTTLSAVTFTANWTTSHPNGILVVAVKPTAAEGEHASRTAADTITVSDSVVVSGARPRTVEDTVAVSDAVAGTSAKARTTADTVSISDAVVGQKTKLVTTADTITLSDAATRSAQAFTRTAGDTVTISEQAVRVAAKARTVADVVTLSDAASRAATHSRTTTDAVSISDAFSRGALGFLRSAGDTVVIADSLVAHVGGIGAEPNPPTTIPNAGHVSSGRTGRISRTMIGRHE